MSSPSFPRSPEDELTRSEVERYDRQLRIAGFGRGSQLKLKRAKVAVVGAGGLGSAALLYLAAAGIGRIKVVDDGVVELSNLNRQILYTTEDIGRPKPEAASRRLRELNPEIEIEPLQEKLTDENAEDLLKDVDLAIDCLDNFETRFILNRACISNSKPLVHGAVYGLEGRLMTIIPRRSPCLACLIPRKPKEAAVVPVLGSLAGLVGALEALEAVKLLAGLGSSTAGRLLVIDGYDLSFYWIDVRRDPSCPICGEKWWIEER
ncbi:MAG TPA: HesA/MoeB/ThiF family protein [Nitrososphaeria archaeon]|nr:HesA/MoeB/ThiF family protein [Nitrososphaeria archaeon]